MALENAYRKAAAVAGLAGAGEGAGLTPRAGTGAAGLTPRAGTGAAGLTPRAGSVLGAGELVLGVDTIVTLGARIYGKPADVDEARATLRALAGHRHAVLSGVCLIQAGRVRTAVGTTIVELRALDDALLEWYLATGEWSGRAGGYAIQGRGAVLVRGIEGDYLNVVGLPAATLFDLAPELLSVP